MHAHVHAHAMTVQLNHIYYLQKLWHFSVWRVSAMSAKISESTHLLSGDVITIGSVKEIT